MVPLILGGQFIMNKFSRDYKIRLFDIDSIGNIKTISVLSYFQECFAEFCREHQITGYDLMEKGLMWVVTNINLEMINPNKLWGEEINVEIWFSEVKKLRAYLEFKVFDDKGTIAQGDSCWMVLNKETRRPVAIDEIVSTCGINEEMIFESHKKTPLAFNKDNLIAELDFKALYNDLDYNGHVNNLSYLDWGVRIIPLEYFKSLKLKKCSVEFHKECFVNEDILTTLYQDKEKFEFCVIKKEDNSLACKINAETILTK